MFHIVSDLLKLRKYSQFQFSWKKHDNKAKSYWAISLKYSVAIAYIIPPYRKFIETSMKQNGVMIPWFNQSHLFEKNKFLKCYSTANKSYKCVHTFRTLLCIVGYIFATYFSKAVLIGQPVQKYAGKMLECFYPSTPTPIFDRNVQRNSLERHGITSSRIQAPNNFAILDRCHTW